MAKRRNRGRRGGGGSKVWPVIIFLVLVWWIGRNFFSGEEDADEPARRAPAEASFAMNFDRSWPDLDTDQPAPVATDLTAANYYLVLDGSGSMQEEECSAGQSKMDAAKSAVIRFAEQIPASANLGLAVFDGSGLSERIPLGPVDRQGFMQTMVAVQANGGTPLRNAVGLGYAALEIQGRVQLGYGEYHLVVVTDGEANEGQDPTAVVDTVLTRSPVVLHTIGFCIGERHSLNQPGRIDYRAADDPDDLARGLASVLAESPDFTVTDFN